MAKVEKTWAAEVCRQARGGAAERLGVPVRVGVRASADVMALGLPVWSDWLDAWAAAFPSPGAEGWWVEHSVVRVRGVDAPAPQRLEARDLDAALALADRFGIAPALSRPLAEVRAVAADLLAAGATLTGANLRQVLRLEDRDVAVLVDVVRWLAGHADLSGTSLRQIAVRGLHTKWLEANEKLVKAVTGRDVRSECLPRPAVVHLTYLDPGYLASGARRHDSWTAGDAPALPYQPSTVLIVENRDSRLWFPPTPGAVAVEGGGSAAAAQLASIPWIVAARRRVYWGDLDQAGFAILDALRSALALHDADLLSLLMDGPALARHAGHGTRDDPQGRRIHGAPKRLTTLTGAERTAYDQLSTRGDAPVRRIEQEHILLDHARAELGRLLPGSPAR